MSLSRSSPDCLKAGEPCSASSATALAIPCSFIDLSVVTTASADMTGPSERVVALGVGNRIFPQRQCRRRLEGGRWRRVEQSTQAIDDVRLGDDLALDGFTDRLFDQLFVVV